jgi:hypothetical protein
MEVVDYRITEGGDYQWGCFGHNAYSLDSWNGEQDGHSFTIIFDTKTQEVYEIQAHDYVHQRAYRLINPIYADRYRKEANYRSMMEKQAWDDVDYVDLETDDDWMQKAIAIAAGEDYDTRVSVPLDLPDDLLLEAALNAHRQGITLNDYINNALMAMLEEYKRDPNAMKDKVGRWKEENDIA